MTSIVIFCLVAITLNIVIALITRYVDKEPSAPNFIPDNGVTTELLDEVPSLLERYGEVSDDDVPDLLKSIDANLMKYLSKYSKIEFDEYYTPVDWNLSKTPYELNKDFVKIGTWSGDIDFLVKRNRDGNIYAIDNDECSNTDAPDLFATSFERYMASSYAAFQESEERHEILQEELKRNA